MTLTAYLVLIFKYCQRISRSLSAFWGPKEPDECVFRIVFGCYVPKVITNIRRA